MSNSHNDVKNAINSKHANGFRAMENSRLERYTVLADKKRPIPASSSAALEAKEKRDQENNQALKNQIVAYNEPSASVKQDKKTQVQSVTISNNVKHDIEAVGEAMKVFLTNEIGGIILGLLDGDVITHWQGDKGKKKFSFEERQQFKLFGKKVEEMGSQEATVIANLILRGEEKDVEEVITLVKEIPNLLRSQCIAIDPLKRRVIGTPLQIAAMAGDVNLIEGEIKEEKDRGLVERLKTAAGLSDEEVRNQLEEVLTSKEAVAENEKRNKHILDAVKTFAEGIIILSAKHKKNKENLKDRIDFQTLLCQPLSDQLEKALTSNFNEIIKSGYIFDLQILLDAAQWFENNVQRFRGHETLLGDVFWTNCFGKLQSKLSSRDAQIITAGIENLVNEKKIPSRTLLTKTSLTDNKLAYFYNAYSRLGVEFYVGHDHFQRHSGLRLGIWPNKGGWARVSKDLVSSKKSSVAKLTPHQNNSKQNQRVILYAHPWEHISEELISSKNNSVENPMRQRNNAEQNPCLTM